MKVCLIIPPSLPLANPRSNTPLGVLYVASYLEKFGIDVQLINFADQPLEGNMILPDADIYGISIVTPQIEDAKNICDVIKSTNPNIPVIAGGPHPTALPEDTLQRGFDAVVLGEGEEPMLQIVKDMQQGSLKKKWYNEPALQDLDAIPFPARHLLPDKDVRTDDIMKAKYVSGGTTCMLASRGCPFHCSFCPNIIRTVRRRSIDNVVDEIKHVVDTYGIHQFKFQDDCFTLINRWLLKLCNKLQHLDIYFRCITRADRLSKRIAKALYKSGCRDASFGTESGSNKVLAMNNKMMTVEDNEKAYKNAKEANLTTICNLIFGLPGEDRETVDETKSFLERNRKKIDVVNLGVFVPYPNTAIRNNPDAYNVEILERSFEDYWFVGHAYDDGVFVRNKDVSLEEMIELKVEMFRYVEELGYAKPEWEVKG